MNIIEGLNFVNVQLFPITLRYIGLYIGFSKHLCIKSLIFLKIYFLSENKILSKRKQSF